MVKGSSSLKINKMCIRDRYVYKHWAGLYENLGRYIYVNRGFGFHAYPGRVGIMPEITVIQLKKGEKVA